MMGTLQLTAGVFSFLYASQGWLWASGGFFLCGSGVRYWAFDSLFEDGKQALGFSMRRGLSIMFGAYIAAGICAIVGLFRLNTMFAAFVTPFVLVWIGVCVHALRLTWNEASARPPESVLLR